MKLSLAELSFSETMAGTLIGDDGLAHALSFTVQALDEGRGYFRLVGNATAEPWARQAPAEGVLVLRPRSLRYRVAFAGPGGRWTVAGQKSPSLRHPLRSMTTLPVTLTDAQGQERARGDLRFDLADLPRFLRSWLPGARRLATAGG